MGGTLLAASCVVVGLMAGLFAAFAYAVMPGLRRVDDATFVETMRQVNRAILGPSLAVVLGGSLLLPLVALGLARSQPQVWPWVGFGLVLTTATLVVTVAVNVPLNDRLEAADGPPEQVRRDFEAPWVRANLVRTATSLLALVAVAVAALRA